MARLLVVDDDRLLLDVLSLALGEAGHDVRTAGDGLAALEQMQTWKPKLVVADINMPRLDGFALCRKLREAGDETPVVLLTSRESEIDETLGLELGADDYVTKPFAMRVLVTRIAALLRRDAVRAGAPREAAATVVGLLLGGRDCLGDAVSAAVRAREHSRRRCSSTDGEGCLTQDARTEHAHPSCSADRRDGGGADGCAGNGRLRLSQRFASAHDPTSSFRMARPSKGPRGLAHSSTLGSAPGRSSTA